MITYASTGERKDLALFVFFLWLQKEQQLETTKKNSIKFFEKTLSKP